MNIRKQTGTANTTYCPGRQILYLAVHYTAGVSSKGGAARGCAAWFANPAAGGSADYIVDEEELVQYNPDPLNRYCHAVGGDRFRTAGGRLYGVAKNCNCVSLEICSTNSRGKITVPNDPAYSFTERVLEKAKEAVKQLMQMYGIGAEHVIRHYDCNGKCCLPMDKTELLTPNGWIGLDSVRIGMKVAQYEPEGDRISFQPVMDVVEPREDIVLKNRYLEATADHRMYVRPNCKNSHDFREMLWGDVLEGKKSYEIKTAASLSTDGIELTDDEIRLLVWIQGDGHYMIERRANKNPGIQGVEFHLKKERKIARIITLLEKMGITYKTSYCASGSVHIRVYGQSLYHWAEMWLTNKVFNYNLIWMNQNQFEVFWEELMQVDGCVEGQLYSSAIDHNNDVVQAICSLHGKRSSKITMGNTSGGGRNTILTAESNYTVGQGSTSFPVRKRKTQVSCVTVPSGFILVRSNNRTFIVGNCPGVIGWNKDSGDESKWEAFHAAIGGEKLRYYRVGKAWNGSGCDGQIGAFVSLENAIDAANRIGGVTVYDWDGRVMYVAPEKASKGAGMTQASDFAGLTEKERALKALELIHQVDDLGILPSVTAAQWVLESGYCTTDLARQAQNCFGMKCELSGNNWKSVWDGSSRYGKLTEEQDRQGNSYRVWAEFRKYPCIEDSIRDHSLYLLGAKNGSRLRYAGLTEAKDYRSAIRIIKDGGYATDVRYVDKICDIIRRYGLDRYDWEKVVSAEEAVGISAEQGKEAVAENAPVAPDGAQEAAGQKLYVVQAGAFDVKGNARKRLREVRKLGGEFKKAFMVKSGGRYLVQTGEFEDEGNARRMTKMLEGHGIEAVVKVR